MPENFTVLSRRGKHGRFSVVLADGTVCAASMLSAADGTCKPEREGPMPQAIRRCSQEPLPLDTAILSMVVLSLLMWNIALRLVGLLFV
jgi:hypothetical protein